MRERNQRKLDPGAVVYGSPSISQNPLGAWNSPFNSCLARPPMSAPRCGNWYGHTCSLKSLAGLSRGPASNITTFRPPSVSTLAAVPPPAPDPMMQTSNTFGERITCDMESSLKDQVENLRVQELQIARSLSTEGPGEMREHHTWLRFLSVKGDEREGVKGA